MMFNDLDVVLDSLLGDWHKWEAAQSRDVAVGFPSENVSCKLYRASRQYDDENGEQEARHNDIIMHGVGQCIARLPNEPMPWQISLRLNAKNLATGAFVWGSTRLPADREERAVILMEARIKVLRELQTDGLV